MEQNKKQAPLYDPQTCPCKSVNCPRNKNCEACRENHRTHGGKTACERRAGL